MTNIFDIYDLADIPESIKIGLKKDPFGDEIIQLFKIANRTLSIDEVYVAHYRKFFADLQSEHSESSNKVPKTKRQITLKLYNMAKDQNSPIESVEGRNGLYRLKKPEINLFNHK